MIDVIVPVYNVEKYLHYCIESILNQTYKDFILYLIDDGSTDKSSEICDEYSEKYDNVKVIHKKNGGLSDARNCGLENSFSEYITFIDSDDYYDLDFLEVMFSYMVSNNFDAVFSGMRDVYSYDERQSNILKEHNLKIWSKEEAYKNILLQHGCDVSACAKLYKRKIFDNVRYPVGVLYEDIQTIDKIIEQCSNIGFTDYIGYNYLQRSGSIMYSKMDKNKMILINASNHLLLLMKQKYPENIEPAIKRFVYCNYHILGRAVLTDGFDDEIAEIRGNILKYKYNIFHNGLFSFKEKIASVTLSIGVPVYRFMWKAFCKVKNKRFI